MRISDWSSDVCSSDLKPWVTDHQSPLPPMTRILGIDPGSQRTGVGIIDVDAAGRATHVFHAPLLLLGEGGFAQRLKRLLDGLTAIITEHRPDEVEVEKVFMGRHPDSALKHGQDSGAARSADVMNDMQIGRT